MGGWIALKSEADGFAYEAWREAPSDARRGGLILIHEIFGVTGHIRDLTKAFAAQGYETLAPSLFDRKAPRFAVGYEPQDLMLGRDTSEATPWDQVASDLTAAVALLEPPVFVVGYCWGGTAAWLAACRVKGVSAVSAYYGRRIPELVNESPACSIMLHFGEQDSSIPPDVIEAVAQAHPDVAIHTYAAGHGFASDRGQDFRPDAARLAELRTLQLFARQGVGQSEI